MVYNKIGKYAKKLANGQSSQNSTKETRNSKLENAMQCKPEPLTAGVCEQGYGNERSSDRKRRCYAGEKGITMMYVCMM
jgi:hypothetical protein